MNDIIDETQILIGKTPSAITACMYFLYCQLLMKKSILFKKNIYLNK